MVGNDIIDLKQAALDSNWQRKGFLSKVFTSKEIGYIQKTEHPFHMVWQLWSMKESAYKINMQQYKRRFFSPKKIECTLFDDLQDGVVKIDTDYYVTFSTKNMAFIHTVAVLTNMSKAQSNYFKMSDSSYKNQNQTCHSRLKDAVAQRLNIKKDSINIKKSILGIPKVYENEKPLDMVCSITHHGNYGAYAIS